MKRKHYKGYRSYGYLEPGTDYRAFKLVREIGRVPAYDVGVTPEQEARVQRLFQDNLVISLHDHAFVVPEDLGEFNEYRRQGRDWTGYEGLAQSGLDCVFDGLMNGTATITSKAGWKWDDILYDLGMRLCDIAHQDMVVLALTTEDIRRAKANGQIAFVASLEAATMIENEVDRLDILYGFGIRSSGIAYSEANTLGCGLREARDGGLTDFGRQAVRRMNKLGIAIDISHSGDQTSLDTIEVSEKPIFITHAGARALWNTKRMKPDHVLKACAEKGGVIGIEAAPHTTLTEKHARHSLESVMEHFEYTREPLRHRPRRASGRTRCSATTWGSTITSPSSSRSSTSTLRPTSRGSSTSTASRTPPKRSRTSCAGSSSTTTRTTTSRRSSAGT